MELCILLNNQLHTTPVRNTNTDTGILHRTGDTHRFARSQRGFIFFLHSLQCLYKTCGFIYDLPIRKNTSRTNGIAVTDLPRCNTNLICHHIQQCLCGKARLSHTKASEGARRRIIGIISSSLDLKILIGVWTCCMGTGTFQYRPAKGCKSTCIRNHFRLDSHNMAFFITTHGKIHLKMMTFRMDQQRFCSCQTDFDRTSRQISNQCSKMLNCHIFLASKTAAHKGILALHLVCAKHQTAFMECAISRLVCGNDHDIPVIINISHCTFRFQKSMFRPWCLKMMRNHMRRLTDGFICIASADMFISLNIGCLFIKYKRCTFRSRFLNIMYSRQYLIFNLNELLCLLCRLHILRRHKCNGISQIMRQSAYRDHCILIVLQMADLILSWDICCRKNINNPRQSLRRCCINRQNSCSRILTSERRTITHAIQIVIIRIFAVTQHLLLHVQSVYP